MIIIEYQGDIDAPVVPKPENIKLDAWYTSLRQALLQKLYTSTPLADGYKLLFKGVEEVRAYSDNEQEDKTGEELKAFMKLEHARCPFLTLQLSLEGPYFKLVLTGPDGTQEWLKNDFNL